MKKFLLYIVLASYAVVMIKPIMPYISDVIGHALFYSQHMATMHFENGKYHVHTELLKNVKEQNSDKVPSPSKKQKIDNDHIKTVVKEAVMVQSLLNKSYSLTLTTDIYSGIYNSHYHPPRV